MLKRTKMIIDQAAEQVIKQERTSQKFNERVEREISEHQKKMMERRKKFSLIRNK